MLGALQEFITTAIGDHGLLAIFVLMLLESACVPIPSEVTMLFGGAMTDRGVRRRRATSSTFWAVVVAGTIGNLVGSWLAYWAGTSGGRPLVDRFGRYLLIRPHEVDRAQSWFERRGEAHGVRVAPAPGGADLHLAARPGSPGCRSGGSRLHVRSGACPGAWPSPGWARASGDELGARGGRPAPDRVGHRDRARASRLS